MRSYLAWLLLMATLSLGAEHYYEYQWNLGPTFNFARYELGALPDIEGYLTGLHTDFQFQADNGIYSRLEFDGRWNAGFICGDQDTKSEIKDYRPQWFIGYTWWTCGETFSITPFTGYGFYYLSDELMPDLFTVRYFNNYIPVGFMAEWEICTDEFYVRLLALYRPDVHTRARVTTPNLVPKQTCKIELQRSHGFHIEMPFRWIYCWDENVDFLTKVVPFFDWNRFGAACQLNENNITLGIPQLDRWYLGLHVDIGIRF